MATLFITCGVPTSGKTTLAKRREAEQRAVRLTADEWLAESASCSACWIPHAMSWYAG
ncbi:MAG: AAA family ATPase [Chloroflexota bacterium]